MPSRGRSRQPRCHATAARGGSRKQGRSGGQDGGDEVEFDHTYSHLFDGPPSRQHQQADDSFQSAFANMADLFATSARADVACGERAAIDGKKSDYSDHQLAVVPMELAGNVGLEAATKSRIAAINNGRGDEGAGRQDFSSLSLKQLFERQRDQENIRRARDGEKVMGAIPAKPKGCSIDMSAAGCSEEEQHSMSSTSASSATTKKRPTAQERRERKLRALLGKARNPFEKEMELLAPTSPTCRSRSPRRQHSRGGGANS